MDKTFTDDEFNNSILGKVFTACYDKNKNGLCLVYPNGTLYKKEYINKLLHLIINYYDNVLADDINEYNENLYNDIYKDEYNRNIKNKSPKKRIGYVYILKADNGLYKIGLSKTPKIRLDSLNIILPYKLKLKIIIKTDCMYKLEKELHNKYINKNIKGEWYKLNKNDLNWINKTYNNGDINES